MDTNIETPVQPPTDIASVAIHLSYLRRDMQMMNAKIDGISNNFATKADVVTAEASSLERFKENRKTIDDHEMRVRDLERAMWKYIGASSIVSSIVSAGGLSILQHFFK